ncbi:MAG: nuclear transport factor 2 family protein [Xanthobacteraceae bacterium]
MSARTPQQIFQHHAEALGAEDIDDIAADYSDDAFLMTPAEVQRGKAGIRHAFAKLLADIPQAKWNLKTQLYENDILLLEWTADSAKAEINDGIDTFVFKDGFTRANTVRYTLLKK